MKIHKIDNIVLVCCKNGTNPESVGHPITEAIVLEQLKLDSPSKLFKPLHQLHEHCPTDPAKFHYYFEDITHKHSLCS